MSVRGLILLLFQLAGVALSLGIAKLQGAGPARRNRHKNCFGHSG